MIYLIRVGNYSKKITFKLYIIFTNSQKSSITVSMTMDLITI